MGSEVGRQIIESRGREVENGKQRMGTKKGGKDGKLRTVSSDREAVNGEQRISRKRREAKGGKMRMRIKGWNAEESNKRRGWIGWEEEERNQRIISRRRKQRKRTGGMEIRRLVLEDDPISGTFLNIQPFYVRTNVF